MVDELKTVAEIFETLGADATKAFVWWLMYKSGVVALGYLFGFVFLVMGCRLIVMLTRNFSTFNRIHTLYGYIGEVTSFERETILARINRDIETNGTLRK